MQPKQNMSMLEEDDNASNNFEPYGEEKSTPEAQDREKDHKDLVGKN